jgi:hypothetical protein
MNEDLRTPLRHSLLAEGERVKYKRGRSRDETLKLLSQGKSVEVSQTEMESLSRLAVKKGTNVRTNHGKGDKWFVTVLDPSKLA